MEADQEWPIILYPKIVKTVLEIPIEILTGDYRSNADSKL